MIERVLIVTIVGLLGWLAYWGWTRYQLQRVTPSAPGLEVRRPGVASILYFTAPYCAPCKTVQRPALKALETEFGERLQIITIDATEKPDIADHWRVMSVPTTFVLDDTGTPRAVNSGVARTDKLQKQLAAIGLNS